MKDYDTLRITDEFMFKKVLSNNPELCRRVLEVCIGKSIDELEYIEPEYSIKITEENHGVRFDVFAMNGQAIFSAEMQNEKNDNLAKRSRYYHSEIDSHYLRKGKMYEDLKDAYVIFFCNFDYYRKGKSYYRFRMIEEEDPGLEMNDGQETIYLNFNTATYSKETAERMNKDDADLKNLMLYFHGELRHNELVEKMENAVQTVKDNNNWRNEFMTLEEMKKRERKIGIEIGRQEGVAQCH